MRIAMVAPPWYEVPPRAYGGIESLVAGLVDGLVDEGHEVLLVSAGASRTRAQHVVATSPGAAELMLGDETTSLSHGLAAEDAVRDFAPDVVHDHTLPGLLLAEHRACPTVATVHGRVTGPYGALVAGARGVHRVAISRSQRRSAPQVPWRATVRNGIAVGGLPFRARKDDYLLFLGRMCRDKGVVEAIDVAERSGARLLIAARMHGDQEEEFFREQVRPRLGPRIEHLGEVGGPERLELLARARALLFPLQWEEPFGLVVAEAQACGTPVLSLRRGAIPEIVREGTTALLADHHLELVDLLPAVDALSPVDCRAFAAAELDIAGSVAGYGLVYEDVVRRATSLPASPIASGS
ncbi:MAG: glycosyltransferase family 4 protein [Actinobacteria bacterium]|nr:glycosyltransferase family 4 protein [Actinomycetota bacterium]